MQWLEYYRSELLRLLRPKPDGVKAYDLTQSEDYNLETIRRCEEYVLAKSPRCHIGNKPARRLLKRVNHEIARRKVEQEERLKNDRKIIAVSMKNLTKASMTLFVIAFLAGCGTLYTGIITVTSVVDSAMKQWAHLSNTHQTTPAFDEKVTAAHDKYRSAAAVAQASLVAYKASGNKADLAGALAAAQAGAGPLVDLIATILNPSQAVTLKTCLMKANKP